MITWTNVGDYFLGESDEQDFIVKKDEMVEIEQHPTKQNVTREIKTTQYVLYKKDGNNCTKICAKNNVHIAKMMAHTFLEKRNESRKTNIL